MGPRVEEFEHAFADFCGATHAIAVANGTAALHLALLAVGCGPGDEVVVPSLNFVAAANTIVHTGAEPVFCDIVGPGDLNLDPRDLEAAVTPRTKAIVVLHYGGHPCDMGADRSRSPTGTGSSWSRTRRTRRARSTRAARAARSARVGCFSFFSNKNLPVGEGGMIVTDDDELAAPVAAAALTRDDHADVGPPPRARLELRRRRAGLQLPPGRGSRRDRARPAAAPARGERARGPRIVGALPRAASTAPAA